MMRHLQRGAGSDGPRSWVTILLAWLVIVSAIGMRWWQQRQAEAQQAARIEAQRAKEAKMRPHSWGG